MRHQNFCEVAGIAPAGLKRLNLFLQQVNPAQISIWEPIPGFSDDQTNNGNVCSARTKRGASPSGYVARF